MNTTPTAEQLLRDFEALAPDEDRLQQAWDDVRRERTLQVILVRTGSLQRAPLRHRRHGRRARWIGAGIAAAALLTVAVFVAPVLIRNLTGMPATPAPLATPAATSAVTSPSTSPTRPDASPSSPATGQPTPMAPRDICAAGLEGTKLLAWAGGTVGDFRGYHYSGPRAIYPLRDAFPDLGETIPGAWCGVFLKTDTIRWWAVVDGQQPAKVLDITGPGATSYQGDVGSPPVVP